MNRQFDKRRLRYLFGAVFNTALTSKARDSLNNRRKAVTVTVVVSMPTALVFSAVNYVYGLYWLSMLQLAVSFLLLLPIFWFVRHDRSMPVAEHMLMISAVLIFGSLLIDGGIAGTGIYWVYIYPFVAFYVMGIRNGWYWIGAFALLLAAAVGMHGSGHLTLVYTVDQLRYFATAFLFYTLIACIFVSLHMARQAELKEANRQLRGEIKERRRAEDARVRAEAQLLQAEKLKSLGELSGGIAHDFKNLLSVIMGQAEITKMDLPDGSPCRENMQHIETSCRRASELCDQLLAFAGKGKLALKSIRLSELANEMKPVFDRITGAETVLKYRLDERLPSTYVDVHLMRQAIVNLVLNANDALKGEEGVITLTTGVMNANRAYLDTSLTHKTLPEGKYVFIEVADTGIGMDESAVKRVFDPFYSTKAEGRGLGSSATLGIVQGHGGTIHLESEVGTGSRFRILLPIDEGEVMEETLSSKAWQGSGMVMVVDDEELVRKVACRMLQKMGFSTLPADGGRQAVKLFREQAATVTAVLLDYSMPEMDGAQTLIALRDIRDDVPVLVCSGFPRQEILERFGELGANGFMQKPYSHAMLQQKMRKVLKA